MTKTLYILDATGYIFRSYHAIQQMTSAEGESTNALFGFIRSIQKLQKDFSPSHLVAVFDAPDNTAQRKALYQDYKANRTEIPADLPHQIEWAKEFCTLAGIPCLSVPQVEADDTMGSIACWATRQGFHVYLCSSDKDLCQLVNDHVHVLLTHKDNKIVDPEEVEKIYGVPPEKMIDYLAIVGDTSDNVPGLPGFGPKTASTLLQQFDDLEQLLHHPDQVAGKKKQETLSLFAEQARLSRKLVTIDTAVAIPHDEHAFSLVEPNTEALKDFYQKRTFHSFLREMLPEKESIQHNKRYIIVDDEEALSALVENLRQANEIAFDTETTGLRPLEAELVGIGFAFQKEEAFYVPVNGNLGLKKVRETLAPLFADPSLSFYGHNVKYDLHILLNYGIHVARICFDTILASSLLNAHSRSHSLDNLTLNYFGFTKTPTSDLIGKGKKQISMMDVPVEKVGNYCCEDVDYTLRLKTLLEKQLKERNLQALLYDVELPILQILLKMERHGIFLNPHHLATMSSTLLQSITVLEREIHNLAGEEFKINSPKQLSEILFDKLGLPKPKKTQTGYSTSADTLENLKNNYPIVGFVLQYRMLEKLRSTYIDSLPKEINPQTQRIHCTFSQFVAATGRLSCQDPNLQNIPIRTEEGRAIREAFLPQKEGWVFLAADYSQIELRLLAHLSEDPHLIKAFLEGEDIHAYTAAKVLDIPVEEVTSAQRYQAKAVNFGIIYGQQAFGLARELGISVKEASEFIETYFQRYPKVQEFIQSCIEETRKSHIARTLIGRERLIADIESRNPNLRKAAERLAVNTPLQGAAADLIKLAMIRVDKELSKTSLKAKMILQVHDELIFELPQEEVEPLKALVQEAMQDVFPLKVPLTVNIAVGRNWKEC